MSLIQLRESFDSWGDKTVSIVPIDRLEESQRVVIVEGSEKSVVKGYVAPIWKLGEKNLNGRVYSERLGQKIVKENPTTLMLADHPTDDGSVKDIVGVAKNPFIKNKILYAECYIVDENFEKKLSKIVNLGAGIGLSSSGLGELDEDGSVNVDSFVCERIADFVIQPSFSVYITKESEISESLNSVNKNLKENEMIDKDKDQEVLENEEVLMGTGGVVIDDDPENKELETGGVIIEPVEESEDKEKEDDITEEEDEEELTEESEEDEKEEEPKTDKIDEAYKNMKKLTLEQKNFVISMTRFIKEAMLIKDLDSQRNKFKELYSWCENDEFNKPIKNFILEQLSRISKEYENLAEKGKKADSLTEQISSLKSKLTEKKAECESLIEKQNDLYEKFDELKEYAKTIKDLYEQSANDIESYKENYVEGFKLTESVKYIEKLESEILKLRDMNKTLTEQSEELTKELDDLKTKEEEENTELEKAIQEYQDNAEKEKEEEEMKKVEESKQLKEKNASFDHYQSEVVELYEDWVRQNPKVEKFQEEILKCRNVREATMKYLKLKDILDEDLHKMIMPKPMVVGERVKESFKSGTYKVPKGWD